MFTKHLTFLLKKYTIKSVIGQTAGQHTAGVRHRPLLFDKLRLILKGRGPFAPPVSRPFSLDKGACSMLTLSV